MIELSQGEVRVVVDPVSARVESMRFGDALIIDNVWTEERRAQFRGCLLAPWPNRLANGEWEWEGRCLGLPINESRTNSALHGLLTETAFAVQGTSAGRVTLTHELQPSAGYPFRLLLSVVYAVGADQLVCTITAKNVGDRRAPVGLGAHPYFVGAPSIDGASLRLPAATVPVQDGQWQERGRQAAEGEFDFSTALSLRGRNLDSAWTDLKRDVDGKTSVTLARADGLAVHLLCGTSTNWITVYTPPERDSVAVEPQTCGANALRSGIDLEVLQPGDSLQLEWGCSVRRQPR